MNNKITIAVMVVAGVVSVFGSSVMEDLAKPGYYGTAGKSDKPKYNFDDMVKEPMAVPLFSGYPKSLHDSVGVTTFDSAGKQAEALYSRMFPGYSGRAVEIKLVSNGSVDGALGVTTSYRKEDSNYRALGSGQSEVGKVTVEVYDGDINTAVHETAHSIDVSIRGKVKCFPFFEEGQAVFVNWVFFPEKRNKDAAYLAPYAKATPLELRKYVLGVWGEAPPGHDYPLAGFFMCQVYDLAGPSATKYLIQSNGYGANETYKELLISLANGPKGSISEEQFWNILHERLIEWSK